MEMGQKIQNFYYLLRRILHHLRLYIVICPIVLYTKYKSMSELKKREKMGELFIADDK